MRGGGKVNKGYLIVNPVKVGEEASNKSIKISVLFGRRDSNIYHSVHRFLSLLHFGDCLHGLPHDFLFRDHFI